MYRTSGGVQKFATGNRRNAERTNSFAEKVYFMGSFASGFTWLTPELASRRWGTSIHVDKHFIRSPNFNAAHVSLYSGQLSRILHIKRVGIIGK